MENMVNSAPIRDSGRKLFFGLFIFPLIIAIGMAVLLCTVVLLTREVETPESLITAIKTGSPSKRWQKAFELSNELNQGRGMLRESGVMNEVAHILKSRQEYDAKTRSYMAVALSRFEDPEVTRILQEALRGETEPDVQINLIWALGVKNAKQAADQITPFTQEGPEDIQKTAIYVLGVLGGVKHIPVLEPFLRSETRDIRWNAALALARLGSSEGYDILLKMLDHESLRINEGLEPAKIEEVKINAVKGLALIGRPEADQVLKQVADQDPSLKVRQAAVEALEQRTYKVKL